MLTAQKNVENIYNYYTTNGVLSTYMDDVFIQDAMEDALEKMKQNGQISNYIVSYEPIETNPVYSTGYISVVWSSHGKIEQDIRTWRNMNCAEWCPYRA